MAIGEHLEPRFYTLLLCSLAWFIDRCDCLCRALPIEEYRAKSVQAAAIMLMICNNLDPEVAQYPEELVTYGGNGQVFSNWAQVRIDEEIPVSTVRNLCEYVTKIHVRQSMVTDISP